ncbi:MAG: Spy/CpxP family protein refolding chaperone [Candidatus Fermentibacteria bacterium]|nr:Spy/CpxP family protein refolding chaperone [Candidatus Fermentibacteria bacterium]
MKKRITIITVLAAIVLVAGSAVAQPGGMQGRPMGNNQSRSGAEGDFFQRMLPMMRMLNLTDDQRNAIQDIMEDTRESMERIRGTEDPGSQREDFMELFSSSSLSVSEVENLLNQRIEAMEDANSIIAEALVEIHDVLTPEQLAALAEFNPGSMNSGIGNRGHSGANMGVHPHR